MQGAIDIGSNTVRLLIGDVVIEANHRKVQVDSQHLFTTRLGNTKAGDNLDPDAVERTIKALRECQEILSSKGVVSLPVVAATSAVREAANREMLVQLIHQELGWDLQILSGEMEAATSYLGAGSIVTGSPLVIDVGGGSTEVIFHDGSQLIGQSVKVGAVRLYNQEISVPDLPRVLQPLCNCLPDNLESYTPVAVGGTITTIAAVKANLKAYNREIVSGMEITLDDLHILHEQLSGLDLAARVSRYPMLAGRADIIVCGIDIYLALMQEVGLFKLVVSDGGLPDGLLLAAAQ